jgi:hypothetical protein
MRIAVVLVLALAGVNAADWFGDTRYWPNVFDKFPKQELGHDKPGYGFTWKQHAPWKQCDVLRITHLGLYSALDIYGGHYNCSDYEISVWDLEEGSLLGKASVRSNGKGKFVSKELTTPIDIPFTGRKYATVARVKEGTCHNALYWAEGDNWDVQKGNWNSPKDSYIVAQKPGRCQSSDCKNWVDSRPGNYFVTFKHKIIKGDCNPDYCPYDPAKTEPGVCGCGVPDTDSDYDHVPDCDDGCPHDSKKTQPGECGCGVADTDSDYDHVPDCNDGCPHDGKKTEAGVCGCGKEDTDSDYDHVPDCNDGCPHDPEKTSPGECGCGYPDTDSDYDHVPDCNDGCPNDPHKTEAGVCGCGKKDTDSDYDHVPDCNDGCPHDSKKTEPGVCGCGKEDTDSDYDHTPDCNDRCPHDSK